MKLTILGSSSALPTSERNPSAHVLSAHERFFLIDCGEGTQLQMRKHHIRFGKINHIFISHLHGDHVFGLYGLLSTFSLMGRQIPLHIYAPENYGHILQSHLNDFDIHLAFELDFHPLGGNDPVKILDDKYLTVTSFPLKHRIPSYGFLFREKEAERKIIKECISTYSIPVARMHAIKQGEDLVMSDGSVIKNADNMDLVKLSQELKSAADACRKGNINPALIQSTAASFTVSNLGNYGVEIFTPVINLPQSGILGVCTIINRPADLGNNTFGFIPYIGLSLTYDHRSVDGGPATLFLKEIKEQIEKFQYQ